MKSLSIRLCAVVVTAMAATPASAADSEFALQLPLRVPAEGLHSIELTEVVYRASRRRDLADLRIFNANNEALPLAFLPAAPPVPPSVAPIDLRIAMLPAQPDARDSTLSRFAMRIEREGERAIVELWSAPAGAPARDSGSFLLDARPLMDKAGKLELLFAADASDYSGRVDVLGSEDLVNWRVLCSGPLTRNRQLGDVVERTELPINRPPSFLRIAWSTTTAPAVTGIRFVESVAPTESLPRATLATRLGDDRRSLYVEVPEALPVERLFVRTLQPNRVIRVLVYRHEAAVPRARIGLRPRRAPEHWIAIGPLEVFRVDRDGEELEGPPLTLRVRTQRLRIDSTMPFDDPLPVVEAEWRPARVVFAARSPVPYRVAVGNADAKEGPLLDASAMLPADDPAGTRLPVATIGAEAGVAFDAPAAGRAARIAAEARWSGYLLWTVLLLAVAGLAWIAWRLLQQARRPGTPAAARPEVK